MQRRVFLERALVAGVAGALPMGIAAAVASPRAAAPVFLLARLDERSARYLPVAEGGAAAAVDTDTLRITLDALHRAPGATVLEQFSVSALFDVPGAAQVPYHAWHFDAARAGRSSARTSFVAGRATMRGFRIDWRTAAQAGACRSEHCAATEAWMPLQPGRYVLAGPRRDGRAVTPSLLVRATQGDAPLADDGRDFDYLAFRIDASA